NHHRAHSAIGGQPPVTRLTNLPGHHRSVLPRSPVQQPAVQAASVPAWSLLLPSTDAMGCSAAGYLSVSRADLCILANAHAST
ncbi:hypothetical protein FVA95_28070, partial [Pseudonocardia sp. EV170527-09]